MCETDLEGYSYWADFEETPFAQGKSRYAFLGTLYGNGPKNRKKCVGKVFKESLGCPMARSRERWLRDIEIAQRAQELAEDWNFMVKTNKPPYFRIPVIAKVGERSIISSLADLYPFHGSAPIDIKPNEYVAIEDFIPGKYEKFNSNTGWTVNDGHRFSPAFSHFTWWKTGESELVCDLQGVRTDFSYELTDPAIHSWERQYGRTDMGQRGIDSFFSSHKCNPLCDDLPLPDGICRSFAPRRSTTYTFELESATRR